MKDYIVIVFGDFQDSRKVYEVMMSITPIVESENLKFNYNDLSILCHFQSAESQEDIYQFMESSLFELSQMFFISEEKNMSYFMDDNMKKHLMDLSESESPNMVIDMDKIRKG